MHQIQGMSSGSSSTAQQLTAEQIHEQESDKLRAHLLFFHELNGGKGHGHVPRDPSGRERYFRSVRRILSREYKLDKYDLAGLVSLYAANNGPSKVRRKLAEHSSMAVI